MLKTTISLIAAAIAMFVVALAGILSEARVGTIVLRAVLGFLVGGALVYLVMFLLEANGIMRAGSPTASAGRRDGEEAREAAVLPDEGEGDGEEGAQEAAGPDSGQAGFQPLADQDLERVQPPEA